MLFFNEGDIKYELSKTFTRQGSVYTSPGWLPIRVHTSTWVEKQTVYMDPGWLQIARLGFDPGQLVLLLGQKTGFDINSIVVLYSFIKLISFLAIWFDHWNCKLEAILADKAKKNVRENISHMLSVTGEKIPTQAQIRYHSTWTRVNWTCVYTENVCQIPTHRGGSTRISKWGLSGKKGWSGSDNGFM